MCPEIIKIRPFDMTRWVGDPARGIPAPYTEAERAVMLAGSAALLIAISQVSVKGMKREVICNRKLNARRFHQRPNKVKWKRIYG